MSAFSRVTSSNAGRSCDAASADFSSPGVFTASPLTWLITSPGCSPADAAAPSGLTSRTTTPSLRPDKPSSRATSRCQRFDRHARRAELRSLRLVVVARGSFARRLERTQRGRTFSVFPLRTTSRSTVDPGFVPAMRLRSALLSATVSPLIAVITSPCLSPAREAAPPGSTRSRAHRSCSAASGWPPDLASHSEPTHPASRAGRVHPS